MFVTIFDIWLLGNKDAGVLVYQEFLSYILISYHAIFPVCGERSFQTLFSMIS
jgi:hypothetical protein